MRRMKQYDIERRPLKRISIWFMYKLYTETGKWSLHSLAKAIMMCLLRQWQSRMKEYGLACQRSTKNVSIDPVRICRAYKVEILRILLLACTAYPNGRYIMY